MYIDLVQNIFYERLLLNNMITEIIQPREFHVVYSLAVCFEKLEILNKQIDNYRKRLTMPAAHQVPP